MTTPFSRKCAAAQAHRRLVTAAASILRDARRDLRDGFTSSAQSELELAEDLLGLTRPLYSVLHNAVLTPDHWPTWVELVRELAGNPHLKRRFVVRVLLEAILIVRWGDNGAMLVSPLPTRQAGAMLVSPLPTRQARARFGSEAVSEGQVAP